MLSFHNDPALKERLVARMKEHARLDTLRQGIYAQIDPGGQITGCFIGCAIAPEHWQYVDTVDADGFVMSFVPMEEELEWHIVFERDYGIPFDLAHKFDDTFETFGTQAEATAFAVELAEKIPVGKDLTAVASRYWKWYMEDTDWPSASKRAEKLFELMEAA